MAGQDHPLGRAEVPIAGNVTAAYAEHDWGGPMDRNRIAFVAGVVPAVEAVIFGGAAAAGWATGAAAGAAMGASGAVLGLAAFSGRRTPSV